MDINRIVIVGRIASIREGKTANGTFVANVRIAVASDKDTTHFWNTAIWGKLGESLFPHLRVGERFAADGRLLQDKEGGAFISIGRSGMVQLLSSKIESEHIASTRAARAAEAAEATKAAKKKSAPKKAATADAPEAPSDDDIPI